MRAPYVLVWSVLLVAGCSGSEEPATQTTPDTAVDASPTTSSAATGVGRSEGRMVFGDIAFGDAAETGVFVVRATGEGRRRLVRAKRGTVCCLAWSDDGRNIVYSSYGSGLFAVRADTTGQRRLTTHSEGDTPGSWSPDGRSLTFDRNYDGDHSIWIVAAGGGAPRRLTPNGYYAPDWSPDGRLIAYGGASFSRPGIWVMDPRGARKRRLTGSRFDGLPRWSHDGRRLAFVRAGAVWIVNADGSGQRRVVSNEGSEETGELRWSPDDGMLVFTRKQGDRDIFVVAPSGTRLRNLTANTTIRDMCPSWSPDGRAIAFTSDRSGSDEIYVMSVKGSNQRTLHQPTTESVCPEWSPSR